MGMRPGYAGHTKGLLFNFHPLHKTSCRMWDIDERAFVQTFLLPEKDGGDTLGQDSGCVSLPWIRH